MKMTLSEQCPICEGTGAVRSQLNPSKEYDCMYCNGLEIVFDNTCINDVPDSSFTSAECFLCEETYCPFNNTRH